MLFVVEKAVDHLLVGVGRGVGEKGVLLRGRRRQADQVEVDAPEERELVGRTGGRRPLALYSAAMKASIGFVDATAVVGTSGRRTGCSDHSREARVLSCGAASAGNSRTAQRQTKGRTVPSLYPVHDVNFTTSDTRRLRGSSGRSGCSRRCSAKPRTSTICPGCTP